MKLSSRGVVLSLLVSLPLWGSAAVPPEIPIARTFQIFSPFYFQFNDNGENVFSYEGPHLLGYKEAGIIMQTASPEIGVAPFATLQRLLGFLQAPAGILFISTHGGEDPVFCLV